MTLKPPVRPRSYDAAKAAEVIRLYGVEKLTMREVALKVHLSYGTVHRILTACGVTLRAQGGTPGRSADASSRAQSDQFAKQLEGEASVLAERHRAGASVSRLAAEWGVGWMCMRRILAIGGVTQLSAGRGVRRVSD